MCMIVRTIREGDGPTYVLLPGYMFDAWSLEKLASKLSNSRVIIVEHTTDDAIVNLSLWANELSHRLSSIDADKFYLVGYSMGGWLAQYYAQSHSDSVEGLILCGTCWANDFSQFSVTNWIDFLDYLYSLERHTFVKISLWNSLSCVSKSDQAYMSEVQSLMNSNFPKYQDCLYQIKLMGLLVNQDLILSFDKKILVLYSNHDLVIPASLSRNLVKHYPSAYTYSLDGGHLFVHENATECSRIIKGWVGDVCCT
ncbi:alpha/beta hydrolase [Vibrio coralliilyticus]|nr:alpha/beta hydrolase [Vibrio coralliilyticus]NOI47442.1 alpha/beta hydrolase [Vibrio coralliilyticus]